MPPYAAALHSVRRVQAPPPTGAPGAHQLTGAAVDGASFHPSVGHPDPPETPVLLRGRGCPFLSGQKGTKKPPGDDGESIFRRRAAFNLHTISPGPPIVRGRPDGALFLLTGAPHGDTFPPPMLPPPVLSGEICAPTDKGAWCSSADWCAGGRRATESRPYGATEHHQGPAELVGRCGKQSFPGGDSRREKDVSSTPAG